MDILFPILDSINYQIQEEFINRIIPLVIDPDDRLISYIHSYGGEVNIASYFVSAITDCPITTIAYAGPEVFSAAVIIYSTFGKRYAFKDSKFLIHECIPPIGMQRTEIFEQFDTQVWNFMSKRMKISFEDLDKLAKKGDLFDSEKALEIGLVHEIINASWKEGYKKYIPA